MWLSKIFIWVFIFQIFISYNISKPKFAAKSIEKQLDTSSLEYESENLIIHKISNNVYQHISYLDTQSFGRVGCNGMLVVKEQQAIIFDTPTNNENSLELINFLVKNNITIKAIVATHFHSDFLGGLEVFHKNNIPSYALYQTIELAKKINLPFLKMVLKTK